MFASLLNMAIDPWDVQFRNCLNIESERSVHFLVRMSKAIDVEAWQFYLEKATICNLRPARDQRKVWTGRALCCQV